jgi:biopolymer transport protein ExbB
MFTALRLPPPRWQFSRVFAVAVLALTAAAVWPNAAAAWWNDQWSIRKKITIDTSQSGANITEPIGSMPVLIRLHSGNFRFEQAKDDGSDLRIVAEDDKTPLKYHIEKYDSLLGEAFVWVNVPDIKPGAKVTLWVYYGNKKAPAASDPKGTYDPDTLAVYHFEERATPAQDASAWANHAQSAGRPAEGAIIGYGLRLDGSTPVSLPASPSFAMPEGTALTWSAWVKPAALQHNSVIYSRQDGANGFTVGLSDGSPFVEISSNGNVQRSAAGAPIAPGSWHHLAVTATPGLLTVYLDGNAYATLNATLPALNSIAFVGGTAAAPASAASTAPADSANPAPNADAPPAPAESTGFAGDIDELQISKAARSAGFIKAAFFDQGPEHGKFITYDADEEPASWFTGYFAVILKSVTLDGWVVIGALMVMAVISWAVMVSKALLINRQYKANSRFEECFRQAVTDLSMLDRAEPGEISSLGGRITASDGNVTRHSSLYRIYRIGADEIRGRFDDASAPKVLTAQSIAAIRAALDGGFIRETQQLNRLMVLLTIAISGGPFLGLLGTVVGVMITFAAIAESGDVNVNAIAPGIAAALVATVAGLGVAIPALFGYNYLVTRIKDLSADMQIFIDEFITKAAEFYDDTRGRQPETMAAE